MKHQMSLDPMVSQYRAASTRLTVGATGGVDTTLDAGRAPKMKGAVMERLSLGKKNPGMKMEKGEEEDADHSGVVVASMVREGVVVEGEEDVEVMVKKGRERMIVVRRVVQARRVERGEERAATVVHAGDTTVATTGRVAERKEIRRVVRVEMGRAVSLVRETGLTVGGAVEAVGVVDVVDHVTKVIVRPQGTRGMKEQVAVSRLETASPHHQSRVLHPLLQPLMAKHQCNQQTPHLPSS